MANKASLRFFENIPVCAVWDEESANWWFCAMDIAEALTKSKIRENIGIQSKRENLSCPQFADN